MKILMLNQKCIVLVISLFLQLTMISYSTAQNLLLNPGCEDTIVNGEIPHWEEIVGSNWTQRSSSPPPYEGNFYFFAGVAATAELRQDIDVLSYAETIDNNNQSFIINGYFLSWYQSPPDLSRIIIEFLDSKKTTVLDSFDSGNYSNTSTWDQISDTRTAPPGTRFIRVRLISTRQLGSNNDGYYDDLSLIASNPSSVYSEEIMLPKVLKLSQNYPNPFNPITKIEYMITSDSSKHVNLNIYDLRGTLVRTLVDEFRNPGIHSVVWDGIDKTGNRVSSGVYIYRLQAGGFSKTNKMLLIR